MERIGLLTSGGDAPGMNAAIRGVTRTALQNDLDVLGFQRGYAGLVNREYRTMDRSAVGSILEDGGTILRTFRCPEFKQAEAQEQAVRNLEELGVQGLVVIGGDGSLTGAHELDRRWSGHVVGIPATIDNDIGGTSRSLGFDTAVNTALELVDRIRDTATSHERTFIVEVMGRHAGHIAVEVGLAGGAEEVLIPEKEFDVEEIGQRMRRGREVGKLHYLVILAEGAGKGFRLADQLEEESGMDTRVAVLGHTQRGGSPTALDRVLGAKMGYYSVEALLDGVTGVSVGIECGERKLTAFPEVVDGPPVKQDDYRIAHDLSF